MKRLFFFFFAHVLSSFLEAANFKSLVGGENAGAKAPVLNHPSQEFLLHKKNKPLFGIRPLESSFCFKQWHAIPANTCSYH